jgi:predicted transcriptional regulator of viral defense system
MDPARLTRQRLQRAGVGAFFRPRQLGPLGFSHDALRLLVREGSVERVSRGLYRLADAQPTEHYSLAAVCARAPRGIVCLLSALRVHGLGSRLPAEVWLAIPHKARRPALRGIKVRLIHISGAAAKYGIDATDFEGVPAHITNPTRTVVDCFRFERLIGREASMEALRDALRQRKVTMDSLYRMLDVLPSRRLRSVLEAMGP